MGRTFGGIFLVAGTSIGAGMLALPVVTAQMGFYPAILTFGIVWLATALAALFIMEANLWHHGETNLVSMAKHTLGRAGQVVAWLMYLGLVYSLIAAYTTGGGALFSEIVLTRLPFDLPSYAPSLIFVFLFGALVFSGLRPVDLVNRWFFIGMGVLYLGLLVLLTPEVNVGLLARSDMSYLWLGVPVITTAFGFHVILPSLKTYLHNEPKKLRMSVIFGSLLTLSIYLLWDFLILSVLPFEGEAGLAAIAATGQPAAALGLTLQDVLGSTWVGGAMILFSFFAVITSFLGVSVSASHFLMDGLNMEYNLSGRLRIFVMTYLPPVLFALYYPQGFVMALGFGGVFVAVLFMIVPALMVWRGRYNMKLANGYRVSGGRAVLLGMILIGIAIVCCEIAVNVVA